MNHETEQFNLKAEDQCQHFNAVHDNNGEIAICYCNHPNNQSDYEGNCAAALCPLDYEGLDQ